MSEWMAKGEEVYFDSSSLAVPAAGAGFLMWSSRVVDGLGWLVFLQMDSEDTRLAL